MKPKPLASTLVVLAWLAQPGLPVRAIEHYFFTDLGPINNTGESARSINRDGLVLIGSKYDGGNLLFDGTTRWDLRTLVGAENGFFAYDINDDGVIVGKMLANNGTEIHAAALVKSSPGDRFGTNLVDLEAGSTNSMAVSINDNGAIAGRRRIGDDIQGFVTSVGGALNPLPADFLPNRIGPGGHAVGRRTVEINGVPREHAAILWNGGPLEDLGTLTGLDPTFGSDALALNRVPGGAGVGGEPGGTPGTRIVIVGWEATGLPSPQGAAHAFWWQVDSWKDLDTRPQPQSEGATEAHAVNRYGEVVGILNPLFQLACMFRDDAVINLNFASNGGILIHGDFGWTLQTADAINEFGQIAGWANRQAVEVHAFLLTPLRLFIDKTNDSVRLSWVTALQGYSLESTTDPTNPSSWKPVGADPVIEGPLNVVTLSIGGPPQFYRLTGPGI